MEHSQELFFIIVLYISFDLDLCCFLAVSLILKCLISFDRWQNTYFSQSIMFIDQAILILLNEKIIQHFNAT